MGATQILNALPGESLIGIDPPLLQQGNAGWLQRLSLFTGRTLSDTALDNEQLYRAGRLCLLGQAVTPGVVQGLDLSVDLTAADPVLSVAPGYGIGATGQDVTLPRALRTTLGSLAVFDSGTAKFQPDVFSKIAPAATEPWAGILLLQSILADVPGSVADTSSNNIVVSGNLGASCDQDPTEYAFSDPQLVDGARLIFVTWPSSALSMPVPGPAINWRNRLAYAIFNAEQALPADGRLPWEFIGVPLALAGFDAASKLLFADRNAVVRAGGLPRRRYILPQGGGQTNFVTVQPALANARVSQLAEQLGEDLLPTSPAGLVATDFAFLPPAGILPAYTMDFPNKTAVWCPSNWNVTAAPVYTEELEGVLQSSITAAPLDTTQPETVEVLVPLPDEVYDPSILVTEIVAPIFQQEVDAAADARNLVLRHRKVIELEANALAPLAAEPLIDLSAGLTADEIAARDGKPVYVPTATEAFATVLMTAGYVSTDLQQLQATAGAAPYQVTAGGKTIPFFSQDDWTDLETNGIQHFINRITANLNNANDLIDRAFLTTQTDIYRYRQNLLATTDATRLAVSPILSTIASGVTATATSQNIIDYLTSIKPSVATSDVATRELVVENAPVALPKFSSPALLTEQLAVPKIVNRTAKIGTTGVFTPLEVGTEEQPANAIDITRQSPLIGAQLNLRTISIAERLAPSPAQEALFYSIANRVAIMQLLADLEITIDDIPILADNVPTGVAPFTLFDLRTKSDRNDQIVSLVKNPSIVPATNNTNPDEGAILSQGLNVMEQHTQMLRAVEARIQQYHDFLALCATALTDVQSNLQSAQNLVTQLGNDLTQTRQNFAFVQALLTDEQARVKSVNATRTQVLQTYVQFVAFTRPRTVVSRATTPSRQLVPATVSSPVPACLKQTVAIPPELREMVALLREAPVSWFPPIFLQLPKLERPSLLQDLASDTRIRATMLEAQPLHVSSAASDTGLYASAIASTYTADQQVFRGFQTARANFQPSSIANQSWTAQVGVLSNVVAVGDLMSSEAVHAEIAAAASRALQQISSVATCLYTRVGQTLPIDRLNWAQFLEASASINLRSLAVLPGWNSQEYTDRQQMQLLVDWLFQQIDTTNATTVAVMNDLIAVAILLASDAPVDGIIAGAVALRTTPVIGNPIRLTLPNDRVAHGMYVDLYSAGTLAARGVVTDLDTTGVTANVTDVYLPNVSLQVNDVAHYTGLDRNAVVYKAFSA